MRFRHEIKLVTLNGSAVLAHQWFREMLSPKVYDWFNDEAAKHFPNMQRVYDTTLAGYHFKTKSGESVLELR